MIRTNLDAASTASSFIGSPSRCIVCVGRVPESRLSSICPAYLSHGPARLCAPCMRTIRSGDGKCPLCRAYFDDDGQAVVPNATADAVRLNQEASASIDLARRLQAMDLRGENTAGYELATPVSPTSPEVTSPRLSATQQPGTVIRRYRRAESPRAMPIQEEEEREEIEPLALQQPLPRPVREGSRSGRRRDSAVTSSENSSSVSSNPRSASSHSNAGRSNSSSTRKLSWSEKALAHYVKHF